MRFALLAIPLAALLFVPAPLPARDSGCSQAAERWIRQLDDTDNADLLRRHTRRNCAFSGRWVAKNSEVANPARRERMCNDLVLIWTHKNCGYFRDVVNPEAYEPCKAWSREMFRHCMANDVDWFP